MLLKIAIIAFCVLIEHAAKFFFAEFLTFSYNTGMAFSLFSDSPEIILIFSGISCAVLILVCLFTKLNFWLSIGLSMMTGGALSNFLERFFYGRVIDWIPAPLPFLEINFNLADAEISLGALMIVLALRIMD